MVDTGLECEKDTKTVEPWSLPSRKIVLFLVLGDSGLSLCAHSPRIVGPWRKADEVMETLFSG